LKKDIELVTALRWGLPRLLLAIVTVIDGKDIDKVLADFDMANPMAAVWGSTFRDQAAIACAGTLPRAVANRSGEWAVVVIHAVLVRSWRGDRDRSWPEWLEQASTRCHFCQPEA
jgi:hypothetical protein